MSRPSRRTVKVAIVGSGLAGLTAAQLLTSANEHADANGTTSPIFDVHLFEKVCIPMGNFERTTAYFVSMSLSLLRVERLRVLVWTRTRSIVKPTMDR